MNLNPTQGVQAPNARFLATMEGVRRVCRERSALRAAELGGRFNETLARFRTTNPGGNRTPAIVSIALDRFVGEARSAIELACAPGEATSGDVARVEQSISTLNQMYVASEQAISVGTMSPASFMPGAEAVLSNALHEVRAAADQFLRNVSMSAEEQRREEQRRDEQRRLDDSRRREDELRAQQRRDDEERRQRSN